MPSGAASVRELRFVGTGACADVLERAHLRTVGDLRDADLDDIGDDGPLKRLWAAIRVAKDVPESRVRDWVRVGVSAYHAILRVKQSEPSYKVPHAFQCSISLDWMEDPVITVPSGVSYERAIFETWAACAPRDADGRVPDPITGVPVREVVPNRALKLAIAEFRPLVERFEIPAGWIE